MTITHTETTQPRIYVACLASYTNGILHGAWIEAAREPWDIWAGISAMLAASPVADAEEWAVHDYEGFGGVRISEYEGVETIAELATFIVEHGALGAALLDHYGNDLDEAREAMESRYLGCYASLADYVQEIAEDAMTIPETLRFYIDWQAMARDTEMGGDIFAVQTDHDSVNVIRRVIRYARAVPTRQAGAECVSPGSTRLPKNGITAARSHRDDRLLLLHRRPQRSDILLGPPGPYAGCC